MPDTAIDETVPQVDLTNCDREPIHALGAVQDYGCLVALSADWIITHASTNVADLLGLDAEAMIGTPFTQHFADAVSDRLRVRIQSIGHAEDAVRIFDFDLLADGRRFDISISASGRGLVLEFEPKSTARELKGDFDLVQPLIARVRRQPDVDGIAREAARCMRAFTGFDRVMIYRFAADDSGEVIAEARRPEMTPFLGLRFPASDIPKQARALYLRSLLRIIPDVDGTTHPIVPGTDPSGQPIDLSLTVTRAVSPIHLEYLRNMGVGASMSVSILSKGRLWGLIACHHDTPHHLDYERRSAVELFAQFLAYEITQHETERAAGDAERARAIHDRLMAELTSGTTLSSAFENLAERIGEVVVFDGIALYSEGAYSARGSAPTEEEFVGLARFLNTATASTVFHTDNLVARFPGAEAFGDRVAGLLAIPVSRSPRDYLVLFRREVTKSVQWGGNPEKPVDLGPNGIRLTPRKSFEAWSEIVRHHCEPWGAGEISAAEALRITLLEVVLKITDEADAARRRANAQQELLIAELNHRVRNILNLIRGLINQSKGGAATLAGYAATLDDRIHALSRAHDQLTEGGWTWAPLRGLVETEIAAFIDPGRARVRLTGDAIELTPGAFTTLALVIHELVTNSAKYGALSDGSGHVTLDITLEGDGSATLHWTERGGPPVQSPTRRGFGSTIIERSVPYELRGRAEIEFRLAGVEATFWLPATVIRAAVDDAGDVRPDAVSAPDARIDGTALIVEDNMIIAMDAADMCQELGARQVQTVGTVSAALAAIAADAPAVALLDVNLGAETSVAVAEACTEHGVPFALATGYGGSTELLERFPDVPIIKKPYTIEDLRAAIERLG